VRKWVLIAAFALASVSVQAAERIDRVPAENDAPAAAAAPVAAAPIAAAPAAAPRDAAKPQVSRTQIARMQASRIQASSPRQALRVPDEQKARRIAAAYGIRW
jgi:hypothetical protein